MKITNKTVRSWFVFFLKRCGDMFFAIAVALFLSVIVNQPTVVVHVIGHPAYLTTEPESLERVYIKIAGALLCLCLGCLFDHLHKENNND